MGHYCRICGKHKPNEKFSGKGHKNHICKACSLLPKKDRNKIDYLQEMYGFWEQKNISKNNISRLGALSEYEDVEVSDIARVLRVVGTRFPLKKKRLSRIAKEMPEQIPKLESAGLIQKRFFSCYAEAVEEEANGIYDVWDEYSEMERNKA